MIDLAPAAFDYASLDAETRIVVQQRTSELKMIARRAATDVIEIGAKLVDVKERLPHGQFGRWLEAEFQWSEPSAQRFMRVAERFQNRQIDGFAPSALYMLAAPSVPDEARAAAVVRAQAGEPITVAAAKVVIAEHTPPPAERTPATLPQLEAAVRSWLPSYSRNRSQQLAALTQIKLRSPAGNAPLAKLIESSYVPKPYRLTDVITACAHVLTELQTPARESAKTPSLRAPIYERPVNEPADPQCDPDDLPAVVEQWLSEQVEAGDLADDRDGHRIVLRQILNGRNGVGQIADAWRNLRSYRGWPGDASTDDKVQAVRTVLDRLSGAPELPPLPDHTDAYTATVTALERFIAAATALRRWAQAHAEQVEDDYELSAALDLLAEAHAQALSPN